MKLKLCAAALATILMTSLYHHPFPYNSNKTTAVQNRTLLEETDSAQYDMQVEVFLSLRDAQLLLDNHFFKSGFEQSLKDFFNPDPTCDDGPGLPSYRGIDIDMKNQPRNNLPNKNGINNTACVLINTNLENSENIQCYLIVKTKCSGKRKECSERVNQRYLDNLKLETSKENDTKKISCGRTISNVLANKTFSSAIFNFKVDDTSPTFSFDFKSSDKSLSGAKDIKTEDNNDRSEEVSCLDQCKAQHQALQDIYEDFGKEFFVR